jgi:ribonuclease R
VLGEIDDPGMEIEIALRKFDVPHEFSAAALAQAEALPDALRSADLKLRVDLRDVPFVTIDGEDARDFDDAVYCEPIPVSQSGAASRRKSKQAAQSGEPALADGGWRLLVAIADVSHYVTPGSPLEADAQERSTSVYFPRRVIPMLPEKLSNGLCSLKPKVDRLVLVCDMVVTQLGLVKAYQFYPGVIHSAARLTYNQVWGMLSGGDLSALKQFGAFKPQVDHLHDVFRALHAQRVVRGAMDFDTAETKIVCDAAGKIERIVAMVRNDAHRLIEECMLAANVCTADFIERSKHTALFRVHEGPTPEKLERLRDFLKPLGLSLSGGDKPSPRDYAKLAPQIRERPDALLVQTMMLRSMQQAVYAPGNLGHFGLAYEAYTHFTSPIRRYPDLLVHRVIKALLGKTRYTPQVVSEASVTKAQNYGRKALPKAPVAVDAEPPSTEMKQWVSLGQTTSSHERRADDASRDVEAWLKCQYMRTRIGETYRGHISGVATFGLFVTLDELFVEGMVHISELGGEYFQFNEAQHELRGERTGQRFRLMDPIDVQISRVDLEARRIELRWLARGAERRAAAAGADETVASLPGAEFNKKLRKAEGKPARKGPPSSKRGARKAARKAH